SLGHIELRNVALAEEFFGRLLDLRRRGSKRRSNAAYFVSKEDTKESFACGGNKTLANTSLLLFGNLFLRLGHANTIRSFKRPLKYLVKTIGMFTRRIVVLKCKCGVGISPCLTH